MARLRITGRGAERPSPDVVRLRRVGLGDEAVVARQRARLFREMDDLTPSAIRRYLPRFRRWFRAEIRARRLWGYLALDARGRPVGGALLWLQPRLPSPRFGQTVGPYIFSVFTERRARGRGVATRLVSALLASAEARGFARAELHATEMGRHVYERLGFEPTTQMRAVLGRGSPARRPERRRSRATVR
jgi:GNAT superfamily N-acetyltransferase